MSPLLETFGNASKRGYFPGSKPLPVVTGGTLTSDATYYYRTFTASSTLAITGGAVNIDTFTMGGGSGASSNAYSGYGGGAGGFYRNDSITGATGSYTVTIGAGGAGLNGGQPTAAQLGSATTFGSFTANGGGTTAVSTGQSGGSGGGGNRNATAGLRAGNGGAMGQNGTAGSNAGGTGSGAAYSIAVSGTGGIGGLSSNTSYGGGGGGGAGVGNGGNGADGGSAGNAGNPGGTGAGGGSGTGYIGGNGGSGIVIVRYTRASVGG